MFYAQPRRNGKISRYRYFCIMHYSKHYNWYHFNKILTEYFGFKLKNGIENTLTFTNGTIEVTMTRSNNMSDIYVEEILKKLNLTMKDFDEAYKTLFDI